MGRLNSLNNKLDKIKRTISNNGILRIYSSKYTRLISVQMMKSCVIVNENPHH